MSQTFLLATDTTEAAVPALRVALELAQATGAAVVALHVVETPEERLQWSAPLFKSDLKAYKKLLEKQIAASQRRLREQVALLADNAVGVDVQVVATTGSVADTVLETARALEASLIILSKGRRPGTLAAMADRIARLARRPVLIVPAKWTRRLRARRPLRIPSNRRTASRTTVRAA